MLLDATITLSDEQLTAVVAVVGSLFAILVRALARRKDNSND